jgi:hypothetical protein
MMPVIVGLFYLLSLPQGVFGSEARVTGSVSKEAAGVPGSRSLLPIY